MIRKSPNQNQKNLFLPLLKEFIDMNHELVLLSDTINWKQIEDEFSPLYSNTGQPAMPIRLMVGCLMLKRLYNFGDETLAMSWVMNPYMQYFCGEAHFQHRFPCDPSDFVHFRNRIGDQGIEKIFSYTIKLHGKDALSKQVLSDTTVQENNTTFPTDAKLAKKIIDKINIIAHREGIEQRQSYSRTSKQLLRDTHNANHPKRKLKARKASKKLKTIAVRVVRELEHKLPEMTLPKYRNELDMFMKILTQTKDQHDKIYSLHKPFTACIAKGKAHKQYEFGNKVGLMVNPKSLVIVGIDAFVGNPHDSKTIEPLLNQMKNNLDFTPHEVVYERGGRGQTMIGETKISTPKPPNRIDSEYQKRAKRKKFRRRAAIEPVIGHLKTDFRMAQNYYHGRSSPKINALMAAIGWNLKKLMEKLKNGLLQIYCCLFYQNKLIVVLSS